MKDKLVWILAPIALLVVGYVVYQDYIKKSGGEQKMETKFNALNDTTKLPEKIDRRGLYEQEWSASQTQERKITRDEDFFGNDVPKDSVKPPKHEETKKEVVEEKPKVIVKYVVEKKKEEKPVVVVPQPVVKKKNRSRDQDSPVEVGGEESTHVVPAGAVSMEAVVHNDQKVFLNGTLSLRTTEEVKVQGKTVPRNTFVVGAVSVQGERVMVTVSSIKLSSEILSVNLRAYDATNGGEGIYVPGGVNTQIKQDAVSTAINEVSNQIRVPIVDRVLPRAGQTKVYEQAVNIPSGIKVVLKSIN